MLKSVTLKNYRTFSDLEIQNLRRVNIIGGLNSAGKSTLIEGIFNLWDYKNPASFIRLSQFRSLPTTLNEAVNYFFHKGLKSNTVTISAETKDGSLTTEFTWGGIPTSPVPIQIPTGLDIKLPGIGDSYSGEGVIQTTSRNGAVVARRAMYGGGPEIGIREDQVDQAHVPQLVYLSRKTIDFPQDLSSRFTEAVQQRQKTRIVRLAQAIAPHISDLSLLSVGGVSLLHAELTDGQFLPLGFCGDGVSNLVSVGLAIISCSGGAVLLDEFDASIHYSMLQSVWTEISRFATEFNCQIFAVTHSKECISAAYRGLSQIGADRDFQFIRLDRVGDVVKPTHYDAAEMENALTESWEVR